MHPADPQSWKQMAAAESIDGENRARAIALQGQLVMEVLLDFCKGIQEGNRASEETYTHF